jgi:pyruvate,water dikinase
MSAGTRNCVPLAELRAGDEPRFGGKSASLGELLGAGLRVPPGFALAAAAQRADGVVDDALRAEIARQYAALAAGAELEDPPVAVRSSAIGEDSAEATFAGQQETILWVRGLDAVCEAVQTCWASLYSETAVAYRAQMGGDGEPAMGVTIQLMVDSLISGVMFTCNPISGDPSMVAINASWGLGLAIVGGEVTPDDYLVSRVTGEVVRQQIAHKHVEYVPDPGAPRTILREVEPERADAPTLDTEAFGALLELARAAHAHFGSHQDIEWAIARTGTLPENLFVLQSRPVTTITQKAAPAPAPGTSALSLVMAQFGAAPKEKH